MSWRPRRRVRVPTFLQQEAAECGAACLAMILAAHGRWLTLAETRELCGVGRDGVRASRILRAARALGLIARGLRVEPGDLATLPTPFVAYWNFNHFVVVERYRPGGRSAINDPAVGPRQVGRQEFEDAFTGVVLTFEPGPGFVREGARPSLAALLGERMRGGRRALALAGLAGILLVVPGIVAAGFTRLFIDRVLASQTQSWLMPLIGALAAFALLRATLTYLQQVTLARSQAAFSTSMAVAQMWRLLHLRLGFFAQRFAGDIAHRFTLIDRLSGIAAGSLVPAAVALVSVGAYGGALVALDGTLGLLAAAATALVLLITVAAGRILEDVGMRLVKDESRWQAATIQGVAAAADVKAGGTERLFLARWMGHHARVIDADQRARVLSLWLGQAAALVMALATVGVLVAGGRRVIDGATTIGVLLAVQTLLASLSGPVLALVGIGGQLQQVRGIAERLDDVAHYGAEPEPDGERGDAAALDHGLALELDGVAFGYGPLDPPFVTDVTWSLPAGSRIALVGASGSGKSTVGRLMVGLIEPRAGEVRLGGALLRDWPRARLRKAIGYLEQDPGLFAGTVRDTITLWDASLPEERILRAAQDAGAHAFIAGREGGYDARVGESGANLSGGERQRLALARALAVDPLVLVLDEATSALDAPVEAEIMAAIRRRGCTCVVITHRLATVRDCDAILVLDRGRVVETGTHDALIARSGAYRALVQA
ncbi:cysteine peptidase family C39 domain-containing protein [Methylobacterium nonmethylotrophicum]|nr:cysteine peptidase family C39 domain-containing protein [Methylobacterium nonmethylotrophicum]